MCFDHIHKCPNFVLTLLSIIWSAHILLGVGPSLDLGRLARGLTLKENWPFLPQKSLPAHGPQLGMGLMSPFRSMPGRCLASCGGATTGAVSS